MIKELLDTDWGLLDISHVKKFYTYDCIVQGYTVWKTEWSDNNLNGKFHRYVCYGPFAELMAMLEGMNLLDNKIAIEYNNGLYIGFCDGDFRVGTSVLKFGSHEISKEEILERYNRYKGRITKFVNAV